MTAVASPDRLTFADLCDLEPRLIGLQAHAEGVATADDCQSEYRCRTKAWFNKVVPAITPVVGNQRQPMRGQSHSGHAVLHTSAAYDAVYNHFFDLHDCWVCSCP